MGGGGSSPAWQRPGGTEEPREDREKGPEPRSELESLCRWKQVVLGSPADQAPLCSQCQRTENATKDAAPASSVLRQRPVRGQDPHWVSPSLGTRSGHCSSRFPHHGVTGEIFCAVAAFTGSWPAPLWGLLGMGAVLSVWGWLHACVRDSASRWGPVRAHKPNLRQDNKYVAGSTGKPWQMQPRGARGRDWGVAPPREATEIQVPGLTASEGVELTTCSAQPVRTSPGPPEHSGDKGCPLACPCMEALMSLTPATSFLQRQACHQPQVSPHQKATCSPQTP